MMWRAFLLFNLCLVCHGFCSMLPQDKRQVTDDGGPYGTSTTLRAPAPAVVLDYGTFYGTRNDSTGIIYFRGVRYADAPIGNLRWRKPVSPPSQKLGNVNATDYAPRCIRADQHIVSTGSSEDCLFGNVYVPINVPLGSESKLPVLVWFHGGGYSSGSTNGAHPEAIMQSAATPFIFASFAYRVGQFGFLAGSKVEANGDLNVGLLDQRAALQWVQRYISQFGGDPSRVTMWGQSAGAGSSMYHMIAKGGTANTGLFRSVIAHSPPSNSAPNWNDPYPEAVYADFVSLVGCGKAKDSLACLRGLNSTALAVGGYKLVPTRPTTLYIFSPVVDGSYITERPVEAIQGGRISRVPLLVGSNSDEGAGWSAKLPTVANTSAPGADETTVFEFIRGQYSDLLRGSFDGALGRYPLDEYEGNVDLQGQQMYGEVRYICTASLMATALNGLGVNVWQYRYDNPHLGSAHHDDLMAFFKEPIDPSEDDLALFEQMREFWTAFVISGNPGIEWSTLGSPPTRLLLRPGEIGTEAVSALSRCNQWHGLAGEMKT